MEKPNYGIDALPAVRNLALVGLAAIVLFILSFAVNFLSDFRRMFLGYFFSFSTTALLMVLYAKFGKFRHRDRMLNLVSWRGDEQVLDVGTGRGLLMIGAAKRLNSGKAIGIDIWNEADLSGNKKENTLKNAELEGVASKIEIKDEDARKMSFADETFDVVLSNLCLHNIPDKEGRRQACREIARVLKPNGIAVLSDFKSNKLYESVFKDLGLKTKLSYQSIFDTFPPLRTLKVNK
jgi:ubiquinone/menaquinone biosynthesis C-methylase UbiE